MNPKDLKPELSSKEKERRSLHAWPYSKDNTKGHFIGDTWQITAGAPRKLNKFPEQFIVI